MRPATYRHYLLGLLTAIFALNNLDRVALGLVLQNIKLDLHLSDTELGFLSGIAFALFYSVLGLPIARWADRGNRVTIISLTTLLWSILVALCGVAGNFAQLLLIRVGVGVGEAGCVPPAQSLIADYFARAGRPRALAIYALGPPLSFVVGFFCAGWLNELYGWRITFILLGLPGLLLGVVAWMTVQEPRRANRAAENPMAGGLEVAPPAKQASVKETCVTLWRNVTFRHILFCMSVIYFFGYGILQWQPTFFVRSYGLKTGEIGMWFALTYGVAGILGSCLGGELASRYAADNEQLQLKATALGIASFGLVSIFIYFSPNRYIAFGLIGLATFALNTANGPLYATIQTLVPEHQRAMAIALVLLCANLVGMGLGPLAVGALSDAFRPWAGEESLRYALLITAPGYCWGAWHLWRASKTVDRDSAQSASPEAVRAARLGRREGTA